MPRPPKSLSTVDQEAVAAAWQREHARLQARTDALKGEHAALALDKKPFDKREHDAHNASLQQHQSDLRRHRGTPR